MKLLRSLYNYLRYGKFTPCRHYWMPFGSTDAALLNYNWWCPKCASMR